MMSDRGWTAVIAECGLDRAQPVLAWLAPDPFARINLAQALAATEILPDRNTSFANDLQPKLNAVLGADASAVLRALQRLPVDDTACPATVFWRVRFRDLHGAAQPAVDGWGDFMQAFRGRAGPGEGPEWLDAVAAGVQRHRDLTALVKQQRALPLTAQDRSLYVRFGWNDDGEVPGLTGLLNAAALKRTQQAWAAVAQRFEGAELQIEAAAADLVAKERAAGLATLDADARHYGIPPDQLAAALYPVRAVPPLSALLTEAALLTGAAHADH